MTPLQINILCGLADPKGSDGLTVDYVPFCQNVSEFIEKMFSVDMMRRKAQLI